MHYAYTGNMIQFIFCIILCLLIIMISIIVINRSIARPITSCTKRLQALSGGDLHSHVPVVKGRDEIHILSESTASLVKNFKQIVDEIGTVLSSIADGNLTKDSVREHYPGDLLKPCMIIWKSLTAN